MNDEKRLIAHIAFADIIEKLKHSNFNLNKNFIDYVFWSLDYYSPLNYIEQSYNFSKEIDEYISPPLSHTLIDENTEWESVFYPDINYITYFGDVTIEGNLRIGYNNRIFITGNLTVKGVLEISQDSCLFVGGTLSATGIKLDSTFDTIGNILYNIYLVAEKIIASEIFYAGSQIYTSEVNSKLIILNGKETSLDIVYPFKDESNKKEYIHLNAKWIYLASDVEKIKSLLNPEIFGDFTDLTNIIDEYILYLRTNRYNAL